MLVDEGDDVFEWLQAGSFRAVAPASQALGCVAGMLVVEGLEVLASAPGSGGGQLC